MARSEMGDLLFDFLVQNHMGPMRYAEHSCVHLGDRTIGVTIIRDQIVVADFNSYRFACLRYNNWESKDDDVVIPLSDPRCFERLLQYLLTKIDWCDDD